MHRLPSRRRRGMSLVEALVALLIASVTATLVPSVAAVVAQLRMRSACLQLSTAFHQARQRAITKGRNVGIQWTSKNGDLVYALYEDGNGNGVMNEDIRSGLDPLVAGPFSLRASHRGIAFSFLPSFRGKDPSGAPIGNLKDPVRFGRSNICSFTPSGESTPGSIYFSDGKARQAAIRVTPLWSRLQVFEWIGGKWTRRG